jgi:hypothetical protein
MSRAILGDVYDFMLFGVIYTSLNWFSSAIFSPRNDDLLTADWQIPRRLAISTVVIPNSRFAQKQIELRAFTI